MRTLETKFNKANSELKEMFLEIKNQSNQDYVESFSQQQNPPIRDENTNWPETTKERLSLL